MSIPTLFAYVDPLSGAIILQLLLAGIVGGLMYFRRMLGKVVGVFTGAAKPVGAAGSVAARLDAAPDAPAAPSQPVACAVDNRDNA
jgi:hypothetical protein